MIDLRLGDYRQTLDGETWDALICDPPYSERTHTGHNDGVTLVNRAKAHVARMRDRVARGEPATIRGGKRATSAERISFAEAEVCKMERNNLETGGRKIEYKPWSPDDVHSFIEWAAPRTRGWMVCMCDHALADHYTDAMKAAGRYVFPELVWYSRGSRVRQTGDGPALWTVQIVVSRPRSREFVRWGSLPGGYDGPQDHGRTGKKAHIGGKPLWLMREIVTHYSRPGDIVCDPCAGYGTTPLAASIEGRRALASEKDAETYTIAARRCAELPQSTINQRSLFDSP